MNRLNTQDRPADLSRRSRLCGALRAIDTRISRASAALSPRRRSRLLIGVSLLFAGAMLGGSWFLEGEDSQTITYVLIAIWWIPFSVLSSGGR